MIVTYYTLRHHIGQVIHHHIHQLHKAHKTHTTHRSHHVRTIHQIKKTPNAKAAQYATVTWRDSSASVTYNLIYQKDVASKDYTIITPNLILESGDYIQVTAETADKITVTLTAQEYMDEN